MKTENMNNNTTTRGNRAYIKPHAYIIKLETNYGVMEDRSIATAPNTPATGDGNAKQFETSAKLIVQNLLISSYFCTFIV